MPWLSNRNILVLDTFWSLVFLIEKLAQTILVHWQEVEVAIDFAFAEKQIIPSSPRFKKQGPCCRRMVVMNILGGELPLLPYERGYQMGVRGAGSVRRQEL